MGMRVDEARKALAKYGLRAEVSQLFGDESSTVVGQDPGPTAAVPPGTVVRLNAFP
jgi:beta-lactam-binding protein with PASTA domain